MVVYPILVLILGFQNFSQSTLAQQSNTGAAPSFGLILASGHDESLLFALMQHKVRSGNLEMPQIIAAEPGPINLRRGLRLLPNQVAPRLSPTDLLVISTTGELEMSDALVALVRRCLLEKGQVWVVGPQLPRALHRLPLDPGQTIKRIPVATLAGALEEAFPSPRKVLPPLWLRRF